MQRYFTVVLAAVLTISATFAVASTSVASPSVPCMFGSGETKVKITRSDTAEHLLENGIGPAPIRKEPSLHRYKNLSRKHTRAKYQSALSVTYKAEVESTVGIVDASWEVTAKPVGTLYQLDDQTPYVPPTWTNYVMWDKPQGGAVPEPEWDRDDLRDFERGDLRSTRAESKLTGTYTGSGWYRIGYFVRTVCTWPAYQGNSPPDHQSLPLNEHICVPKYEGTEPEPRGSFPCEEAPPD